jgi:type IV secretion system protein VirD4
MNDRFNNAVGPQVLATKSGRGKLIPALAVLTLGAGLQVSTQLFAHQFQYQSALGAKLNQIYPPWAILQWAAKWHSQYLDAFMRAGSMGILISAIGLIVLVVIKMMTANAANVNQYLYGSARWANVKDIRAAGLIARPRSVLQFFSCKVPEASSGVYVGAWTDKHGRQHYLRHNGPEHVLCYAPTRSGKGVGLVVPTPLSWGSSAVITDLKGELWAMTAGWRQKHADNKVLRFEPASPASVCWNPLDEI